MSTLEIEIRDYLRQQDEVMELLNDEPARLNLEWKGNLNATHVTLYRAGGGQHEYVPVDSPAVTLHIFGSTRPAAVAICDRICAALWRITNNDEPLQCGYVESVNWLPTSDGVARYVVVASVTAHAGRAA